MPNRLAQEKSPYLLQHAENPVDWYPWGEAAFAQARAEHKPIFLSIGYSTCYWCHVMEKDSFEKEDVARALAGFVCIKVDREEHPEVDEIYMDAVVAMTGHGGWPMSVFLTPELQPFWGGTYIPHDHFLQLLDKITTFWRDQRHQLQNGGKSVVTALNEREKREGLPGSQLSDVEIFSRFEQQCTANFDGVNGGFGGAPKFPGSMGLRMLLRLGGAQNLAMAERSLEAMACGGIFDQLGGGFHRYATDEKWLVPHFEKMLYDNALLAVTYTEAFQATGKRMYADVARATLDYLLRDLRDTGGAFYSAEDAGEVGKEGEFYVWKFDEIANVLEGGGFAAFRRIYPVSQAGNFEHGQNILHLANAGDWAAAQSEEMKGLRLRLWEERETRIRPHRDEKILTAWNGLVIAALAFAGAALGEARYVEAAVKAAGWIREHLGRDGVLLRRWAGGEARYSGTAADYVYLIDGLVNLYQATFDAKWLQWARELQRKLDADFWDESAGGYFTAARSEENLVIRKKDRADGALPSPNSVASRNLIRLAEYFVDAELGARAEALLKFQRPLLERSPFGLAAAAQALFLHGAPALVVIAGKDTDKCEVFADQLKRGFHPRVNLAMAGRGTLPVTEGRASAEDCVGFLCRDKTCLPGMPATEVLKELGV